MSRPKVLVLTPWYPTPEHPQVGVFVREHARAAAPFADVMVLHWAGADPERGPLWRLEEVRDPAMTQGIPTFRVWHRDVGVRGAGFLLFLGGMFRACRQIERKGFAPDILHAHEFSIGVPAILIGRRRGIPVVLTEHASGFGRGIFSRMDLAKARFAFRHADAVLPVSDSLRRILENLETRGWYRTVPNVVDTALFRPGESGWKRGGPARILFVGLLEASHRKGLPQLLDAAKRLARRRDDWRIDVVGDGSELENHRRRAAELGLNGKVVFLGRTESKGEVADRMRQADFLVVPSTVETFAVAAAEALACGTPVLATRSGGPEEYVNDEVGAVIPAGDVGALERGLDMMIDRSGTFDRPCLAAYAAERFGPEIVGGMLSEIYRKVLDDRAS